MADFPSNTNTPNSNLGERARQRIGQMGTDYRHPDDSLRSGSASMPSSLESQTPGLDKTRFFRVAGNRVVAWSREQPAIVAAIGGGLIAAGLGIFFGVRYAQRQRRWAFFRNAYGRVCDLF